MSDDLDFDMEVVEEDELDELGAGGASSSGERSRAESGKNTTESEGLDTEAVGTGERSSSGLGKSKDYRRSPDGRDDGSRQKELKADAGDRSTRGSLYSLSEDWDVRSLGSDFDIEYGDEKQPQKLEEGYPLYGANGIIGRSDEYLFEEPIVTVTCRGATCGNVHLTKPKSWVTNNSLVLQKRSKVNNYFVADALRYHSVDRAITGSAQQQITSGMLGKIDYPVPPLPEQRKIASVLYAVDQAIQKTEAIIEQAQRVKRGLIQDLLTSGIDKDGNRRDPDSDSFQSTSLGKFPEIWELKPLNSIVTESITYGIVQPGPNIPGGVPFIRSGDATADRLDPSSLQRTSEEIAESYSRSRVNAGEIITTIRATVGESHQVPESLDGANLGRGVARIVPEGNVNRRFLLWAMRSGYMDRQFNMYMKGSTYSEITLEQLGKLKVALPDADEQHRIANVLDVQEQNIENEQERLNELRSLKKGLMQDLLTGEVRTVGKAIEVLEEVKAHG